MTATVIPSQSSGILLKNISWKTYESLLNELTQQRGIRLTYDRGNLEIMTPSAPHEKSGELLGNFVEVLTAILRTVFKQPEYHKTRLKEG
jgi:Uma2 family endonuclease